MSSEHQSSRFETNIDEAQGTVIGDRSVVNQHFYGSRPGSGDSISYWMGRPASLGPGFVGREPGGAESG